MKYLLLWLLSGIFVYLIVPPILSTAPQFQQEIYSIFSGVLPSYSDQMIAFAVILSGFFVVVISLLDWLLKPIPAVQTQRNNPPVRPPVQAPPQTVHQPQPVVVPLTVVQPVQQRGPTAIPRVNSQGKPHLELTSFKLITNEGGTFRLKNGDDLTSKERFRPAIGIRVNNLDLVGKALPLQFDLINPLGKVSQTVLLKPILKKGLNVIVPDDSEFKVTTKTSGVWAIKLLVGQYMWGRLIVTMLGRSLTELSNHIGADMEMDDDALRLANEVSRSFTIDDLLRL